jgi:C1A family cysteine protease
MYQLGAIPSPPDDRDYPLSRLTPVKAEFPEEFCLLMPEIKDQGYVGSCVAHSLAYCREITESKQSGENKFSVGFIYANRLSTDYQGSGMYPREALSQLLKCGDVPYNDFPINEEYNIVKTAIEAHKAELMEKALPYKITAYARLSLDNEIKTALMELGPVTIMIPVYNSFFFCPATGMLQMPGATESIQGYHQITIVGWKKVSPYEERWVVLNSWGSNWGDKGKCYMPFNYPIEEKWSMTDKEVKQVYKDDNEISTYAKDSVYKAQLLGLMNGYPDGTFRPKENVTREQHATTLIRLYDLLKGV